MARYLPLVIVALVTIYCVVDVAQSRAQDVRYAPRWLWAVAVVGLPVLGAVLWFCFGRPRPGSQPPVKGRPLSPDDDPDFLSSL